MGIGLATSFVVGLVVVGEVSVVEGLVMWRGCAEKGGEGGPKWLLSPLEI